MSDSCLQLLIFTEDNVEDKYTSQSANCNLPHCLLLCYVVAAPSGHRVPLLQFLLMMAISCDSLNNKAQWLVHYCRYVGSRNVIMTDRSHKLIGHSTCPV